MDDDEHYKVSASDRLGRDRQNEREIALCQDHTRACVYTH